MESETTEIDLPPVETVEANVPYGTLPALPECGEMLGWYRHGEIFNGGPKILLSDVCQGDPKMEEIVKVVSHEYLHHILEIEVDRDTSKMLDCLVDAGNFIVDREENGVQDDRPLEEKWRELVVGHRQTHM